MRVGIVGGGVLGSSVAFHLAAAGAEVTLFEAGAPLGERAASAGTFAWVNANGKAPESYFRLNVDGMDAHQGLVEELGGDWLHPGGSLEWAADDAGAASLRARVETLAVAGYPARMLDPDELASLEPDLAGAPLEDRAVAWFESEAWADPLRFCTATQEAARARGATVRTGARVVGLGSGGDVELASGERLEADAVVVCAGRESAELAGLAGEPIPVGGTPGLIVVTEPTRVRLGRVVRPPGVQLRPDTDGRLALASNAADAAVAAAETPGSAPVDLTATGGEVLRRAAGYLPGLDGIGIAELRVGRRAIPADGLPIVGRTDPGSRLYHLVTHSGVTLAPLLGRLVARELLTGRAEPRLEPYRPSRLQAVASGR